MREIKFRAWDEAHKHMIEPMTLRQIVTSEIVLSFGERNLKWLQFTGLKDKNGKDIYEGDILEINYSCGRHDATNEKEIGRVQVYFGEYDDSDLEWGSPAIGWYVIGYHGYIRRGGKRDVSDFDEQSLVRCKDWEVIGNIYENPELLR